MSAVYTEASITALNSLLHLSDSDALVASTAVLRMQERRLRMFIGEADGMAASDRGCVKTRWNRTHDTDVASSSNQRAAKERDAQAAMARTMP